MQPEALTLWPPDAAEGLDQARQESGASSQHQWSHYEPKHSVRQLAPLLESRPPGIGNRNGPPACVRTASAPAWAGWVPSAPSSPSVPSILHAYAPAPVQRVSALMLDAEPRRPRSCGGSPAPSSPGSCGGSPSSASDIARAAQKRFRLRQKDKPVLLQQDIFVLAAAAQALAVENEVLCRRARMLEAMLSVRDMQLESLHHKVDPTLAQQDPRSFAAPQPSRPPCFDSSGAVSVAGAGAREHQPASGCAPQPSASMSSGGSSERSSSGAPNTWDSRWTLPLSHPLPVCGSGTAGGVGEGGSRGGSGDCSEDTFRAVFTVPGAARALPPPPLVKEDEEEEVAMERAGGLGSCMEADVFLDVDSERLVDAFTGEDARRMWTAFTHEAAACLQLLSTGSGDGGSEALQTVRRLSTAVGRVAAVMRHLKMTKPAVRDSLVGVNLDTGQQCSEGPPDSHWRSVAANLHLSGLQRQEARHMHGMFRQHLAGVLTERQATLLQLRRLGAGPAYQDGTGREEASSFAFRGIQPEEILLVDLLSASMREEKRLRSLVTTHFVRLLQPVQYARVAVHSYPRFPDVLALVAHAAELPRLEREEDEEAFNALVVAAMGRW